MHGSHSRFPPDADFREVKQGYEDAKAGRPKRCFTESYLAGYRDGEVIASLERSSLRWHPNSYGGKPRLDAGRE